MKLSAYVKEVSEAFIACKKSNPELWKALETYAKEHCVKDWLVCMGYVLIKNTIGISIITQRMYAEGANDDHVRTLLRHCVQLALKAE